MSKIPVSLIIDDAGPVNLMQFHDPQNHHEMLFPASFARDFASLCRRNAVKGKFSVVPMPGGLGRVDDQLDKVPDDLLRDTLRVIKDEIEPLFSITPEILTHYMAYDLKNKVCLPVTEPVHFATLSASEIADYVSFALEILLNAGLDPTGVTSPWNCGSANEENYAAGIGMAFRKMKNAESCFYFLHGDELALPVLMCDSPETGKVLSIPENTFDPFFCSCMPAKEKPVREVITQNIDRILSPDGHTGIARRHVEAGRPIILISHWQSLYSNGNLTGLEGLETLVSRINTVFGSQIQWMSFQEITENFLKQKSLNRSGREQE